MTDPLEPERLYRRERRLDEIADRNDGSAETTAWAERQMIAPSTLVEARANYRDALALVERHRDCELDDLTLVEWSRFRMALFIVAAWHPVFADEDVNAVADIEETAA